MRCGVSTACTLLLTGILTAGVAAQPTRLGAELQVNTYTIGAQGLPSVAASPEGDFVVVWHSRGQDGTFFFPEERGVFGQRFSSAGTSVGPEFQVNAVTMYDQYGADIAMAANGNFVVAWQDSAQDGFSSGVFARRFSSAGVAAGKEFVVNEMTIFAQNNAQVSSRDNGDFVAIWESDDAGGGYSIGVKGRVFSSAGVAITGEFLVNSYTEGNQYRSSVGMDSDGDFVVAWASAQGGPSNKVLARRYSSAGVSQGDEFLVSAATVTQNFSAITFAGNDFVVAWDTFVSDLSGGDIFVRRFSSAGVPLATELRVNTYTFQSQSLPDVATLADGGVVVAWHSALQDGDGLASIGRRFSSSGDPVGGEFQINTTVADSQHLASVAADATGRFVVAWQSGQTFYPSGQDGSSAGIFLQRFGTGAPTTATLDIDADDEVDPLTDGLVVLLYLFGLSESTLIEATVDTENCTRCDAGEIISYLDSIAAQLDIDADTETKPLSDGLLAFRFTFGMTDTALVGGAVDTENCTRCSAEDIETYLDGMTTSGP